MLDRRARVMLAALGFLGLGGPLPPVLQVLHRWLDAWPGIGAVVVGMAHQGYDLELTRYGERGWRATFYPGWHGALGHERDCVVVAGDAVAGGAGCRVGGA